MGYISVDLGTTNIKVAAYDKNMSELSIESKHVEYIKENKTVEFDANKYFNDVKKAIKNCCRKAFRSKPFPIKQIILTGQAESLILVDEEMKPLRNGISWLDMRSDIECKELKENFDENTCYEITGQPEIIPTWPITKILWIKKNEPSIYSKVHKYLLLKDFIHYQLTGVLAGEYSIYNFSHYFNISKKKYWQDILSFCGVHSSQLPPLVEPCSVLGDVKSEIASEVGLSKNTKVNIGTLDHFSGMIGTGNISKGIISESTGTVMAIATLIDRPSFSEAKVPCHYGPFIDSYVLLPVCESGGISLEWFKDQFLQNDSYEKINEEISKRSIPNELIFLPYITGVNAPDFNSDAKGVFYGFKMKHDKYDFAFSVMEGIAHLLKVNIDHIEAAGYPVNKIISTGGGARSEIWSQAKANITEKIVAIPANEEAACLGSAIIGAVSEKEFTGYDDAVSKCISIKKEFHPIDSDSYKMKHRLFKEIYNSLLPIFGQSN